MSIDTTVEAIRDQHAIANWIWAGIFKLANCEMEQAEREERMDQICPLKFQHFSSGQLKAATENASLTDF